MFQQALYIIQKKYICNIGKHMYKEIFKFKVLKN